jgi:hypothetical protein
MRKLDQGGYKKKVIDRILRKFAVIDRILRKPLPYHTKEEQIQQRAVYHEGDLEDNMNDDEG